MSDDYCDSGGGGYDSGGGCDYGGGCDTGDVYSSGGLDCGGDNNYGGDYNTCGEEYITEEVCVYDGGNYDSCLDDGGEVVCEEVYVPHTERFTFSSGYQNSTGLSDDESVCSWNIFFYIAAFFVSAIIIYIVLAKM
ncbi:hypothetical protein WA026_013383 [Henosepilachna vigintioctopunctata]|uniref:Transmembrane protein n=1 Tax=Henosepilachna vigintioctopunctata TaxID=420089 RepID=A0AAW1V5T9_9CUCU